MRKKERRGSIERKILASILWVGITPIALALIIGYFIVLEGQRRSVLETLSTAAEKTANGVSLALQSKLGGAEAWAHDPTIVNALMNPQEDSVRAVQDLFALVENEGQRAQTPSPHLFSLHRPDGTVVASAPGLATLDHDSQLPQELTSAQFDSFFFSEVHKRYLGRIVAPVLSPLPDAKPIGYLVEYQNVSELVDFALRQTPSSQASGDMYQIVYLPHPNMARVTYFDNQRAKLQPDKLDPQLESVFLAEHIPSAGVKQIWKYETAGVERNVLLAYHKLGDFPVYILLYRPRAAAFAPVNQWAKLTILGSVIIIFLFCIVAYRNVHKNIVLPVALLNEGAQIIRQGDLELKLKIGTGDEIEELASSFNKMAQALNQNISQLEESEEKYRSLVTSMRDGVYQTDPDGVITFINPAGAEIFGYDRPEDGTGHSLQEFFLEEIDFARLSNELAKRSFIERTRVWLKRRDGRSICVELSGNRLLGEDGATIGSEGIFRDVTNSVRLEQQARERSERISAINQIANVINSSLQAGRLHESLVVELNKMVSFDYVAVALINERGEEYEVRQLWPERGAADRKIIEQTVDESCATWVARNRKSLLIEEFHGEHEIFARDFPEGMKSCLSVPLYATGRIIGTLNFGATKAFVFTSHDIEILEEMTPHIAVAIRNARLLESLQQSLEEVTRAREKLHEANEELKTLDEMKTNLLSNVSHELRTPLVAVMGYADMIYNRKAGPISEVQAEYLSIILRNVEKLVALIENLLDFSRLHRGTEKVVFDTFDIVDCAKASLQTVQPVADSRNIKLELVASDEQLLMEGDKGKMGQVFNNLLSNAVKFNHNGGSIRVEIQRRQDSLEVTVSDTGIGIPQEALDKVFTRFYQYDSSSTRKYGGTGIGLAIAQDIVRLHGSRITATSEMGKGSVFRFSLPLKPRADEETPTGVTLPTDTHLMIQVVSKDRALNMQLREFLVTEGMDIIHASSAPYAIGLAQKYSPDCILVDMEVGGSKATNTVIDDLLAEPELAKIPLIMLTNDDGLHERYRTSVASRVRRDFRKSGLLSGIQYVLSRTQPIGQIGNKILCVDDDPEVLIFISRCLRTDGYTVDTCGNGQEALDKLASQEYGLVLLDIAMPGLDGWEVCRRIRSDASLAGIKVYFVTAKPIDRIPSRLQDVEVDGYLLKPFKSDDLLQLVRNLMQVPTPKET